jgi:hypothetical protein
LAHLFFYFLFLFQPAGGKYTKRMRRLRGVVRHMVTVTSFFRPLKNIAQSLAAKNFQEMTSLTEKKKWTVWLAFHYSYSRRDTRSDEFRPVTAP